MKNNMFQKYLKNLAIECCRLMHLDCFKPDIIIGINKGIFHSQFFRDYFDKDFFQIKFNNISKNQLLINKLILEEIYNEKSVKNILVVFDYEKINSEKPLFDNLLNEFLIERKFEKNIKIASLLIKYPCEFNVDYYGEIVDSILNIKKEWWKYD